MQRADKIWAVAHFGAALLGGATFLAWSESSAQPQTLQDAGSLPPVTADAPKQQSSRRAATNGW